MTGATGQELAPWLAFYSGWMHLGALGLGLGIPLLRMCVIRAKRLKYPVHRAFHDGIAAAALPSLLAMVLSITDTRILTHISGSEYFAAGLLGLFASLAQLATISEHLGSFGTSAAISSSVHTWSVSLHGRRHAQRFVERAKL